jgi:hypothetical protein
MTTPEPTATTVARAAPAIRRTFIRTTLIMSLVAIALIVLGIFLPLTRIFGVPLALWSLAYLVYAVLYLHGALVEFGGGRYRVRGWPDDNRFSAADAALVLPIDEFVLPGQTGPALVVISTTGRRLVETTSATFGTATLEALVGDLLAHGVPIEHLTGRVKPAQFARRYPGVLSFPAAHPSAFGWIVASIAVAIGLPLTAALGLWP